MQDRPVRKKPVNLSIDVELLAEAKSAGTNLSSVLEEALRARLAAQRADRWRDENREAIEASNRELAANGPWYTPGWLKE